MASRSAAAPGGGRPDDRTRHFALVVDGRLVATVEVARSFRDRSRGLLGRDGLEGALLLEPASSVHTIGMRFTLDVAFCDRHRRVIAVRTLRPWRLTRLRLRSKSVLEAQAGSFATWGLTAGSVIGTVPLPEDTEAVPSPPLSGSGPP